MGKLITRVMLGGVVGMAGLSYIMTPENERAILLRRNRKWASYVPTDNE